MTDKDIQSLINTPKRIQKKEPRKGYKAENNHKRCNLILIGGENNKRFEVFIRQNQDFIENFSIGLQYKMPSLENHVTLIRYNGPHGQIKRNETDHHPEPHIHRITQEEIQSGSFNPKMKNMKITDKYNTFEEGLSVFLIDVGISNWKEYFPELEQGRLL